MGVVDFMHEVQEALEDLKEYKVEATDFNSAESDPFGSNSDSTPSSSPWDFGN